MIFTETQRRLLFTSTMPAMNLLKYKCWVMSYVKARNFFLSGRGGRCSGWAIFNLFFKSHLCARRPRFLLQFAAFHNMYYTKNALSLTICVDPRSEGRCLCSLSSLRSPHPRKGSTQSCSRGRCKCECRSREPIGKLHVVLCWLYTDIFLAILIL